MNDVLEMIEVEIQNAPIAWGDPHFITDYTAEKLARRILEIIRTPTESQLQAAANTPGMREVNDVCMAAFARRLSSPGLRYQERGEPPPLVQAWQAMIDDILGEA